MAFGQALGVLALSIPTVTPRGREQRAVHGMALLRQRLLA